MEDVNYIRLSQTFQGNPKNLSEIPDKFYSAHFECPDTWWGTSVYSVSKEGELKYVDSNVDSSG